MPELRSKDGSAAGGCIGSAGGFALCITAVLLGAGAARAESASSYPAVCLGKFRLAVERRGLG